MADRTYIAWSGATAALTAAVPSLATGTTIRTMMQLKSSGADITVVEWGYSFDVAPTALVKVELVDTGAVGATGLTAYASGDVPAYSIPGGSAAGLTLGTTASGFWVSGEAEGTVTATRLLGYNAEWGQSFKQQFPLGREPSVAAANYLRMRVTTATTINMTCYVIFDQ